MENVIELARMLGVAADELIGYYVARAPLEIMDFYVLIACAAVLGLVAIVLLVPAIKHDDEIRGVLGTVMALAFLFLMVAAIAEGIEAYKARRAPQAYAVDQILRSAK